MRVKYTIKKIIKSLSIVLNHYYLGNIRQLFIKVHLKSYGTGVDIHKYTVIKNPAYVQLGNEVSIASFVHIWGKGGLRIGDNVLIGSHTAIITETHDYMEPLMYHTHIYNSITIEDNVWIGAHCTILPGVTIKKGSVIGAGSVVTRDTIENGIYTGIPASLMKKRNV